MPAPEPKPTGLSFRKEADLTLDEVVEYLAALDDEPQAVRLGAASFGQRAEALGLATGAAFVGTIDELRIVDGSPVGDGPAVPPQATIRIVIGEAHVTFSASRFVAAARLSMGPEIRAVLIQFSDGVELVIHDVLTNPDIDR